MPRPLLNGMAARRRSSQAAFALAAAVVLPAGCATLMNGPTQRVAVASDPPGARVFVGDEPAGVTPTFVELERDEGDLALRFEKDCYRDTLLEVPRHTSAWAAGNWVPLGVPFESGWLAGNLVLSAIRSLVDWGTGNAFTFPSLVRATLDRLPAGPGATDSEATGSPVGVEPDTGCAPGSPFTSGP